MLRMVGLSILPVPAQSKSAGYSLRQELHQESLSIIPVSVPTQMKTDSNPQGRELYQKSLPVMSAHASFKDREYVKTFVCVFCPGVTSLVIGEFLQFQVR